MKVWILLTKKNLLQIWNILWKQRVLKRIDSNPLCGGCLQKIKRSKFWHIMSKSSVTAQFTLYGCSRSRLSDRYQRNQLPNCTHKKIVKSHHVLKVAKIQSIHIFYSCRIDTKENINCMYEELFHRQLTRLKIRFLNFIDL